LYTLALTPVRLIGSGPVLDGLLCELLEVVVECVLLVALACVCEDDGVDVAGTLADGLVAAEGVGIAGVVVGGSVLEVPV
jgi:hypothetical protein